MTAKNNTFFESGGPQKSNGRKKTSKDDQMFHIFEKENVSDSLADTVPVFRGVSRVPPNAEIFLNKRNNL